MVLIGGMNCFKQSGRVWSRPHDAPRWDLQTEASQLTDHGGWYSCCQVHHGIVVTGGRKDGKYLSKCQLYDVETKKFESLPDMPRPRCFHGSVHHKGRVYFIGGAADPACTREVDVLDVAGRRWSTAASMPTGMYRPNVACVGDTIIVAGVRRTKKAYSYRIPDNKWSDIDDVPRDVSLAWKSTVAVKDKVLVVGDRDMCEYSTTMNAWTVLTPPPIKLPNKSAVLYKSSLLVMGGAGARGPSADMQTYNLRSKTWSTQENHLPEGLYDHSAYLFPKAT